MSLLFLASGGDAAIPFSRENPDSSYSLFSVFHMPGISDLVRTPPFIKKGMRFFKSGCNGGGILLEIGGSQECGGGGGLVL